jgi:tripartite-type tricarboxylate transporter receptor subunit TctC
MTDVRRVIRPNRRRFLFGSAGGVVSYALGLSPTLSQPLHSTARILVGFPAGGPSDVFARLLAEQMKAYASSTIVENRPGAGGRVVMDVLKNSAADGSVMVLTPAVAVALYPHVYKSLSYNPQQDFAPVTTISTTSMLIAIGPLVPSTVKTLADFIAWCRSNPNQSSYGSPGAGSPLHFLGVMLSRAANFEYLHVPFQGTAPSIQSLLGSQIASCISPIGSFVPHVRAGTLRALATTGAQRSPLLPDVPTVAEAGYPALEFAEWFGIFVPARTPSGTVETLSSVLRAALQTKEMQAGSCQSIGGCRRPHAGRLCSSDQGRHRSLGADREGIRIHAPGLGGRAGFISRANIDEASWPLAMIEHVAGDARYWHEAAQINVGSHVSSWGPSGNVATGPVRRS